MCSFVCKAFKEVKVVSSSISPPFLRAELVLVKCTAAFDIWIKSSYEKMVLKLMLLVENAELKRLK